MDVDEKAAARTKWRQNQRYKRHDRGGKAFVGKPIRRQQPDSTLDANTNRYIEVEDDHPINSRGADLAELLSATERVDVTYYNKLRFELVEEYGLPPPGDGGENVQGLSLDLGGLAACLADQPLHKVLRLAAPPDSDAGGLPDDRHNGAAAAVDILQGPVLHAATQQPVIAQHRARDVSSAPATRNYPAAESKAPLQPSEKRTQSAAESPDDEELDFLLGLTTGAASSGGPGPAALPAATAPQQGEEQSLEDWLDNL